MSHRKRTLIAYIIISFSLTIIYFILHFYIIPQFVEVSKQREVSDALNFTTAMLATVIVLIPKIGEALDLE